MKYWPMSALADNPRMPWKFAPELYNVQVRHIDAMSQGAVNACGQVANHVQPVEMTGLVIVTTPDGGPAIRLYLGYPAENEWKNLERAGVVQAPDEMLYVNISALH